ncbi:MAG: hypothetical protein HDQ95_09125 [Roseburia sp.]|nr:hypothetical protein [Roseburia sp.]
MFYVAITRAKKKVWLVTVEGNESVFIKEIITLILSINREDYSMRTPQPAFHQKVQM